MKPGDTMKIQSGGLVHNINPGWPLTLSLPAATWSQNRQMRQHWSKSHQQKRLWLLLVSRELMNRFRCCRFMPPEQRMLVRISSYRRHLLDHGNLVGGCKELVDALTLCGLIHDDSPEWVRIEYHQERAREPRTEIAISPDPEAP